MRHIIKDVATGMGVAFTTFCGTTPNQSYDSASFMPLEAYGSTCTTCLERWFDAKKEERRIFEQLTENERLRREAWEQEQRDRAVKDAGQRLDGTHPDGASRSA